MQNSHSAFDYLTKAIDSYRGAVQTFARDALIVIGLVALITAFVFFPYLRSAEDEHRLKIQIAYQERTRNSTAALLVQMTNLQSEFTRTRKDIEGLPAATA